MHAQNDIKVETINNYPISKMHKERKTMMPIKSLKCYIVSFVSEYYLKNML